MSANVGYATLTVIPSAKGFSKALSGEIGGDFEKVGRDGGEKAGSGMLAGFKGFLAPMAGLVAAVGFGALVKEAAQASDATQKFGSTLQFAGIANDQIKSLTASTQDYANKTVYGIADIQNITAQLASNGVPGFDRLAEAAGNLNAIAGGTAETYKSVGMVLTQTAGQGKLTTENWNQLSDAIPGASGKLQQALLEAGAYTGNFRDAMAKGEITAQEFNDAILKLGFDPVAVSAARSTTTIEGALGNLQASAVTALSGLITFAKPAITGFLGGVADGISGATTIVSDFWDGFKNGTDALGSNQSAAASWGAAIFPVFQQVGKTFSDLWSLYASYLAPLWDGLLAAVGPLIPQLLSLASSFSPLQIILKALAPVLPTLAAMVTYLATELSKGLGQVLTVVTPLVSQLVSTLSGVFVAIMPAVLQLVSALAGVIGALIPPVVAIVQALVPFVTTLVSMLAPIITQLVTTLVPPLVSILGILAQSFMPIVNILLAVLIPVLQSLMPIIQAVFAAIVPIIQAAMQIIQGIIQVVMGLIQGNWDMVWQGLGNILGGIWNLIVSVVTGAINIVFTTIGAVLGLIGNLWNAAWGAIASFLGGLWNSIIGAVSNGINSIVSFFGGLGAKILGVLAGAGKWLLDVGKNLIQGFLDGINNAWKWVEKTIRGLFGGAVDLVKGILGIHSPSRVFREVGRFTGEGFALGLEDMQGRVADAAEALSPTISASTSAALGIDEGGVMGALGAGGDTYVDFEYTQVGGQGLTAEQELRRSAQRLKQAIRK